MPKTKKHTKPTTRLAITLMDIARKNIRIIDMLAANPFESDESVINFLFDLPPLLNEWSQSRKNFSPIEEELAHAIVVYILLKIHVYLLRCKPSESLGALTLIARAVKDKGERRDITQELFSRLYLRHHPNSDEVNLIQLFIHHLYIPWVSVFNNQSYRKEYAQMASTVELLKRVMPSQAEFLHEMSCQFRTEDGGLMSIDINRSMRTTIDKKANAEVSGHMLRAKLRELTEATLQQLIAENLDPNETTPGCSAYCAFLAMQNPGTEADVRLAMQMREDFMQSLEAARRKQAEDLAKATQMADEARAYLEAVESESQQSKVEERAARYAYLAEIEKAKKAAAWEAKVEKAAELGAAPAAEPTEEQAYELSDLEKDLLKFHRKKEDHFPKKLRALNALCALHAKAIECSLIAQIELSLLRGNLLFSIQRTDKSESIKNQLRDSLNNLIALRSTGVRTDECDFLIGRLQAIANSPAKGKNPKQNPPAYKQHTIPLCKEITAVLEALSEPCEVGAFVGEAYVVGGYPRDKLRDEKPKDMDIVCIGSAINLWKNSEYLRELGEKLKKKLGREISFRESPIPGLLIIDTGIEQYEVLLSEQNNLKDDARKRDSKCNALYINKKGIVIDPLDQGCQHAIDRLYAPTTSMEEFLKDPVRIVRALDFKILRTYNLDAELEKSIYQKFAEWRKLSTADLKTELGLKQGHFAAKLKALLFNALEQKKAKQLAELLGPNLFGLLSAGAIFLLQKNPDYLTAMSEASAREALADRLATVGVFHAAAPVPQAAGAGPAPTH